MSRSGTNFGKIIDKKTIFWSRNGDNKEEAPTVQFLSNFGYVVKRGWRGDGFILFQKKFYR